MAARLLSSLDVVTEGPTYTTFSAFGPKKSVNTVEDKVITACGYKPCVDNYSGGILTKIAWSLTGRATP